MDKDLDDLAPAEVYALLTQAVVPRPIAWVLSENEDGALNLAPFSYFTVVSSDPPTIVVSIGRKRDGTVKDTRRNLEARADCVVHIAHTELAEALNATAATLADGESEVERVGLETVPMAGSRLPRLAACRVALACRHVRTEEVGRQGVAYARVLRVHVDDAVVGTDAKGRERVLAAALEPLSRLGGGEYLSGGRIVTIARPD